MPTQIGELADDAGIGVVAPEGDPRHLEMLDDQELDVVPRLAVEAELVEDDLRHPRALFGVVLVLPLADVVQQQGEDEPFRRSQLGEQLGELRTLRRLRDQPLDAAHGQQRVLVDGVLVVEVADHPAADAPEAGDQALEQPAVVHRAQGRVADPRRGRSICTKRRRASADGSRSASA